MRAIILSADLLLINVVFFLLRGLQFGWGPPLLDGNYRTYLLISNLAWLMASLFTGVYQERTVENLVQIFRASFRALVIHALIFLFCLFFTSNADVISRVFVATYYAVLALGLVSSRFLGTLIEQKLIRSIRHNRSIAVMGRNATGLKLAGYLEDRMGINFEGFLDGDGEGLVVDAFGQLSVARGQLALAAERGIHEVLLALPSDQMGLAKGLISEAEDLCVRLRIVPHLEAPAGTSYQVKFMDEFPMLSLRNEPLDDAQGRLRKRIFDIGVSLLVIVFVLSWLVPILAIIIKCQSRGPVFFAQQRTGRNNISFWCYKFRSMRVNNDADILQASANDKRLTRIGAFMRRTSIDELPQFFNVLLGNMSVIGPRPHMLKHTEQYRSLIDKYMVRQFLKPGISGWAQVNGYRGETKNPSLMKKRVEYDIHYMENWSLMLDVKIVFLTVINMLSGEEQAY